MPWVLRTLKLTKPWEKITFATLKNSFQVEIALRMKLVIICYVYVIALWSQLSTTIVCLQFKLQRLSERTFNCKSTTAEFTSNLRILLVVPVCFMLLLQNYLFRFIYVPWQYCLMQTQYIYKKVSKRNKRKHTDRLYSKILLNSLKNLLCCKEWSANLFIVISKYI